MQRVLFEAKQQPLSSNPDNYADRGLLRPLPLPLSRPKSHSSSKQAPEFKNLNPKKGWICGQHYQLWAQISFWAYNISIHIIGIFANQKLLQKCLMFLLMSNLHVKYQGRDMGMLHSWFRHKHAYFIWHLRRRKKLLVSDMFIRLAFLF